MGQAYIAFDTAEQRQRYRDECARLGYPVTAEWPRATYDGIWDPGVPSGMPEDLRARAYQFAISGVAPSDLPDQHPGFKYLRVPKKQEP